MSVGWVSSSRCREKTGNGRGNEQKRANALRRSREPDARLLGESQMAVINRIVVMPAYIRIPRRRRSLQGRRSVTSIEAMPQEIARALLPVEWKTPAPRVATESLPSVAMPRRVGNPCADMQRGRRALGSDYPLRCFFYANEAMRPTLTTRLDKSPSCDPS